MNAVDIIVPIYNAADSVQRCLHALKSRVPGFARVVLMDDASTDSQIHALCQAFVDEATCSARYVRQPKNLGFVGNVNAAMRASKVDVVLLNSDTQVTHGWLAALAKAAASGMVGSVTPWSNNAEICSFPNFCQNNPWPVDSERIASAAAELIPVFPDLPTGVGFCMYLTRRALQQIGYFDQATFGRGYGEENDWCLRAAAWGFRNILCDNAYVAHHGGRSFAATGEKPGGENLRRLQARYPQYEKSVADFIQADPLNSARARLVEAVAQHPIDKGFL